MSFTARLLLLGSGELGKEFAISAKRLGAYVVACDSYAGAPAMQVADEAEIFPMLDGDRLRDAIGRHAPDYVVPEVEAIRTEALAEVEAGGTVVVPSARAAMMTMNRDSIRELAAGRLGLRTSRYGFAESLEEAKAAAAHTGYPCVVKPVMSSSGKGQSIVSSPDRLAAAWDYAVAGMRGDRVRVIVEEFVAFDYEITLLTVRTRQGIFFCPPVGHRQERGDYQESWQPTPMSDRALAAAQDMARAVVDDLGGYGLFGVEFFVAGDEVIFSELRRLRPVRSRVLRRRRRGDLLRAFAPSARHRHGHPHLAKPLRIRPPRPSDPRPAHPGHRPAPSRRRLGGDPRRPRLRTVRLRRAGGGARARRRAWRSRRPHLRQADDSQAPAHGRCARLRRDLRRSPCARCKGGVGGPDSLPLIAFRAACR
jgi:phosphoribosylglycinamide formyltransferase 2